MDIYEMVIEEVKNRPVLYDSDHSDYRNLKKRENAWTDIAVILNLTELECRKRWKRLRDSYFRCVRMKETEFIIGENTQKKQWRYFNALTFLGKVAVTRRKPLHSLRAESPDHSSQHSGSLTPSPWENKNNSHLLPPTSPRSPTSSPQEKKFQRKINDEFDEYIELAESKISENYQAEVSKPQIQNSAKPPNSTQALDSKKIQYSTATHFAVLAAKIKEANMPPYVINRIEAQVSAFVFGQIESFYSTMDETM